MTNAIPMLILVIGVLIFIGFGLRRPIQQIDRLRRATRGPMAMLPDRGLVGVEGQVSGQTLSSPLSSTPCVLWQVVVETRRNKRWRTIYQRSSSEPLMLDDSSGQVQVLPAEAVLLLADDLRQARGLLSSNLNPEIEMKLEQLGVETRGLLGQFGSQLRVYERYIIAGEQLSALGYLEAGEEGPVLRSLSDTPLFLSDQSLDQVLKSLYRQVASTAGVMGLIAGSFICCLLLQVLEPR